MGDKENKLPSYCEITSGAGEIKIFDDIAVEDTCDDNNSTSNSKSY